MANTITAQKCTLYPVTFTGAVGNLSVSCPGFSDSYIAAGLGASVPGSVTETGIQTILHGDYQFGSGAGGVNNGEAIDIRLTYTMPTTSGITAWAVSPAIQDVTGTLSSNATSGATSDSATTFSNGTTAFTISINSAVQSQYGADTSSSGVLVVYSYSDSATPEPATFSLIGGALLGLGFLGRKKFIRP
jgi:hypothetical protein